MSRYKAIASVIQSGVSDVWAEVDTWTLDSQANDVGSTVIGAAAASIDPGAVGYELTLEGFYDEADAGFSSVSAGDEGITITLRQRGTGSGLPQSVGVYNILSMTESIPDADSKVRFSMRAYSDGSAALDKTPQA